MSDLNLPKPPEGHFWRVKPWIAGSGVMEVQLRRKNWLGSSIVRSCVTSLGAVQATSDDVADAAQYILDKIDEKLVAFEADRRLSGDYAGGDA